MTETTEMRIAVVLYRMFGTIITNNKDRCFVADYADFMTERDNEYIKKYLRNVGCLTHKVRECHFFDGISAEWKVDVNVFKSLWVQYSKYVADYDTYKQTLNVLRTKRIRTEKEVIKNKKHLSEAPKVFTSKHRCRYYINSLSEVYDIVKQRYPFWDDIQNKIEYINERNTGFLPKISMNLKVKHKKGIVSKVSSRYSNCLVSMKAHETTNNSGYTERELYCMKKGFKYEFDVNASIHRLTYMLNHHGDNIDGDVYELIYRTAFPKGKWNDKIRTEFKKLMMRNYFDTSARNAAKNYINSERKDGRYPDVEATRKIFEHIYPALREVEGQTFDNEIFFWESMIMITLIYEMMQKYPDLKVFSVYDGIYFNRPVPEVAEMWYSVACNIVSHYYKLDSVECKIEAPVENTLYSLSFSQYSSNSGLSSSVLSNLKVFALIYTLTDKLTISSSVAFNNVKRGLSLDDFAHNHCILTTFDGSSGSSVEMVESRRLNGAKGKGIKHDATNMKGIKHDATNMKDIKHNKNDYADFFKEHPECVTADYNNFKLAIAPLGLNKSKVHRLWKWLLVNINKVK